MGTPRISKCGMFDILNSEGNVMVLLLQKYSHFAMFTRSPMLAPMADREGGAQAPGAPSLDTYATVPYLLRKV